MTDDDDALPESTPHDGDLLLYDYFKHLTSLCVVSLGGVLALVTGASQISSKAFIAVLVVVGTAAILAFSGASEIVSARFRRRPLNKGIDFFRFGAPVLLSVGVGMFVYMFARTLLK
ncbi:MAG: hypothetical protein ACOY45_08290 [Pseudomonadota bacterium]